MPHKSSLVQKTASSRRDVLPAPLTSDEKRKIFKGMVVGEMEAGFLRYSRRQALMEYASILNIGEFEASLLIAEAQYQSSALEPIGFESPATLSHIAQPESWSVSLRLGLALVVAIFVDLLLIQYFFG